jgi:hypothetical protein
MAISIDWLNKVINVPRADMLLIQTVPSEIRQLDIDSFRLDLKDLEDNTDGMVFQDTHRHNTTVTVGGAVLARVVEIINGYTVTFEDGQYAVNLVGANSNIGDVTNVNQVSVRSSNSAGLQDLNSLQAASFANSVTINTGSAYTGTLFPIGTRQYPVNNMADALAIANNRGLKTFSVASNLTLSAGDFSNSFRFVGDNINIAVTIDGYADVTNCEFNAVTITGTLDNNNLFKGCVVGDMTHVNGILHNCGLRGVISVAGTNTAVLLDCYSILEDQNSSELPRLDMTSVNGDVAIRGFNGELHVANATNPDAVVSIDFNAGQLHMKSSSTAGTFIVRGVCELVTNGSTATLIDKTLQTAIPTNTWDKTVSNISAPGSIGEKIRKNLPR